MKDRAVDLLDGLVDVGIGDIDLDAEVLLFVDEDRLSERKVASGDGSPWLIVLFVNE